MRKVKTSSLKPLWMPHANCFIVHILNVLLCIGIPSSSLLHHQQPLQIKQLLHQMLYSWQVIWRRRVLWEETGGLRLSSTRSPPLQPVPRRSLRQPSPRTAERRWRPDETCSSSPRHLSSTVWFPAQGKERVWSLLDFTCFTFFYVTVYWLLVHDSQRQHQYMLVLLLPVISLILVTIV